jgi:hypothetical protein
MPLSGVLQLLHYVAASKYLGEKRHASSSQLLILLVVIPSLDDKKIAPCQIEVVEICSIIGKSSTGANEGTLA